MGDRYERTSVEAAAAAQRAREREAAARERRFRVGERIAELARPSPPHRPWEQRAYASQARERADHAGASSQRALERAAEASARHRPACAAPVTSPTPRGARWPPIGQDAQMDAVDGHDAQVALNESTFRDVNEGIEEGRRTREGLIPFICECGVVGCNAVVELTLAEYEAVRADSRCFVVAPGHGAVFDELRREEERYSVVRKPDGPLGELADRTDPRRDTS